VTSSRAMWRFHCRRAHDRRVAAATGKSRSRGFEAEVRAPVCGVHTGPFATM